MPPGVIGDGIQLALGTKETISETLEPLSEENSPNLEANKWYLCFTEVEIDIQCSVGLHFCPSNSSSERLPRYNCPHSQIDTYTFCLKNAID